MNAPAATMVEKRSSQLAPLLLALAGVVLAYTLQWTHGHYNLDAMPLLAGTYVAALLALAVRWQVDGRALEVTLGAGLVSALYLMLVSPPTVEITQSPGLNFYLGVVLVAVLAGAGLGQDSLVRRWWFPVVVLTHFYMAYLVLKLAPHPHIDVFDVEVDSLKALLSGNNPYALTFPNPYGDGSPFFPPEVQVNGRLMFGFVYPPLALLLCVPGWLVAHDPRYSTLAAMSIAALLMGYARPGNVPKLAATLFLMTPRTFFVADRAWTDPFVVMLTALVAYVAIHRPRWLFVPLGLYFSLKQHMFIGLPAALLLFPQPLKPKDTLVTLLKVGAVGGALVVPFFLWDPKAFINSVLNIREVYRTDCLSFLAYLANQNVTRLSKWSGLMAMLPVMALGWWKLPRTPFGFAVLATLTHFTLYVFSTHAFCNEYYNVVGGLFLAVALWQPADAEQPQAAQAAVAQPMAAAA